MSPASSLHNQPTKSGSATSALPTTATALALVNSLAFAGTLHAETSGEPMLLAANDTPMKMADFNVEDSKPKQLASPKFIEPLVDTPQTIVVVPATVYNQQGATNLSDVLRNTPGITFAAGEGGSVAAGDSFYMRGFDTSGSIFVDGVRDSGAYNRDVYNLEQVEIAKGPAGADNGRGGTSGYINLATKSPQLESFVSGIASYGSADQKRASIDINETLGASPLEGTAFRLNALWQDSGVPGRDYVEKQSVGIAPSLAFGLNTPTRVVLNGSYDKQENIPDSGLPIVALPGNPPTTPATGPINQENFYGIVDSDFDNVKRTALGAKIEHDVATDFTVRNQFRYVETDRDALTTYVQNSTSTVYNPATGQIIGRRLRNQVHNEIYSNQTNATAKLDVGGKQNDISGGVELTREKQRTPTWIAVNGPATNIYNPNPHRVAIVGGPNTQTPVRDGGGAQTKGQTDTAALYVFDTVHLSAKWLLNASARWEHFKTDYTSIANTSVATKFSHSDDLFSWKTGVVFKPAPDGSLYAAYGNSFTPPGTDFVLSDPLSGTNANSARFDPQENRNYEVGVKWEFFKKRLSTSLALYRSENLNVITQDAATLAYLQEASNRVDGLEAGISGKITNAWFIYGGFAWMDAETQAPRSTTAGTNDGANLRFTPRFSGNLWTAYSLIQGLNIGGGVQYSDTVVRSTSNTLAATSSTALPSIPDYWLFNAFVSYDITKSITLRLNINNVTDEDTFRLNNNGGRYYPGTPRSYLVTANFKF